MLRPLVIAVCLGSQRRIYGFWCPGQDFQTAPPKWRTAGCQLVLLSPSFFGAPPLVPWAAVRSSRLPLNPPLSILNAFGVLAQFGPLQIYSLDLPVHAIVGNVTMNTKTSAAVGTHFVSNNHVHVSPCAKLIWQPGRNVIWLTSVQI